MPPGSDAMDHLFRRLRCRHPPPAAERQHSLPRSGCSCSQSYSVTIAVPDPVDSMENSKTAVLACRHRLQEWTGRQPLQARPKADWPRSGSQHSAGAAREHVAGLVPFRMAAVGPFCSRHCWFRLPRSLGPRIGLRSDSSHRPYPASRRSRSTLKRRRMQERTESSSLGCVARRCQASDSGCPAIYGRHPDSGRASLAVLPSSGLRSGKP